MLYQATHITRYLYDQPVAQCQSEARLTPPESSRQHVLSSRLECSPAPQAFHRRRDYFGNEVTAFAVFGSYREFVTTATSLVEVLPRPDEPLPAIAWEQVRDQLALHPDDAALAAYEYVFNSPYAAASRELEEFAAPSFTPGRPLAEAVVDLAHRIYSEFAYVPASTSIEMPLLDVFRQRRGVCQDFAHIMIAALRSLRLAARYVSGYLRSGVDFQGAEASHAWVAVWIPEYGWLDLDPTNDVLPTDGHVTLAVGRDYGDVTPLKGIALGGGWQRIEVEVHVEPQAAR